MSPDKENFLVTQYPRLFRTVYKHPMESLMFFGCECGNGWFDIIHFACRLIARHVERQGDEDFEWTQIKEKFGTLRLYGSRGGDKYISGVIAMAEAMSAVTCDQCGNKGEQSHGGWIVTRCKACGGT